MDIAQFLNQINPILVLSVVGGFALLLLIFVVVISILSDRKAAEMNRLGKYLEDEDVLSEKERARPLTDWINSRVDRSSIGDKISNNLSRADLKFKPGEFIFFVIFFALVLGVFLW